jgi:hypothetical protein
VMDVRSETKLAVSTTIYSCQVVYCMLSFSNVSYV